ncbi:MAG: Fic family protein [Lysobacterales bacterium CG02_land_8_20_14_3_00_62_12]|nr:MAG: Fic family protein [Xanthomonadales bacterium CG02_land_8_20_14_3_00_62_12]
MKNFPPAPGLTPADWADSARLARMGQLSKTISDTPYLHWEQLRHRPPPAGYSVLEWWQALKFKRQLSSSQHDLLYGYGEQRVCTSHNAAVEARLANLSRQLGSPLQHDGDITRANRDRYISSSLMEEAIYSSLLEGAVATRAAAKDMLRSGQMPTTIDERMIVNNHRAIERVRELAHEPLTVAHVLELHSILTDGTLADPGAAGRMQTAQEERIVVWDKQLNRSVHLPPPAGELPERMTRLVAFANAEDIENERYTHPLLRSILLHFQLAFDHPFVDGNGRLARALFYWSMLRRGYWLTEFISISRQIYRNRNPYLLAYLYAESDQQDATYFVIQQLDVIEQALAELQIYLKRKREEQHSIRQLTSAHTGLNPRQLALLRHALHKPDAIYTHESHANSQGVSIITARSDLLQLVAMGFVSTARVGKKFIYRPADDLAKRLRG